jgi:hypothetical protein
MHGDDAGGHGGGEEPGGQPPQCLVTERPSQWDAIGLLDGGWDGALVVGWTLALLGSPARQGGVGHDRERDEQDRQRHQGVAPAAGLDEPAGQGDIDDAGEPGDYGEGQQGPGPLGSVTKPGWR